jgi:hypothetical protein
MQVGMPHAIMPYPDPSRRPANHGARNMRKTTLEVRKLVRSLVVLSVILLPALHAEPAHAAATIYHSWVSHGGNNGNGCTESSPCQSFAAALGQTLDGGEISCLDSSGFDALTVTISITINCSGTVAANSIVGAVPCFTAITINAPGKVVTLRGLNLNGFGLSGCTDHGILIQAATAVYIEDCVIENFPKKGILDTRTTGLTKLAIKNTIVRNNGSAGIVAGAAPKNSVVLENVQSVGNTYGIAVAASNNVVISRSVMSENAIAGVEADPGAEVYVENTKISHNVSYGVYALGTVVLANSDITFNTSSISGATTSFGNNRLFGNGGGTAPTPVGATSTDFGQQ